MKKVIISSLMVFALSTLAFAQQTKPASKPAPAVVSKPVAQQQPVKKQTGTKASTATEKKSTVMMKPRHKKAHRAKQHTTK